MTCEFLTTMRIVTYIIISIIIPRALSAEVRLVNEFGSSVFKGRVEVKHTDTWGTVCDDGWDIIDADVVCRQLGFTGALRALKRAYFGAGSNLIWMDQVSCRGDESRIQDCPSAGWGTHDCLHIEDASVECSNATVRMVDGPDRYEGNVQLLNEGSWSYVCDDEWDDDDGSVACRQLDGRGIEATTTESAYGDDAGPRLIGDMECDGTEARLEQCPNSGWQNESICSVNDKAGVSCTRDATEDGAVRLVGTGDPLRGRVEIYHNGEWGTVCDDYWDYYDAKVVCRQLLGTNVKFQAKAYYNSFFGAGSGRIWLDNVACYGSEVRLEDCLTTNGWGYHDCYHGEDAGVYCDLQGEFDGAEIAGIVLGALFGLSILLCCVKFICCEAGSNKRYNRRNRGRTQRNRPTTTTNETPDEHFDAHFNGAYTISGEQTEIFTPEGFLRPPPFPEAQPPPFATNELPPTYDYVLANPLKNGPSCAPPTAVGAGPSGAGDNTQCPPVVFPGASAVLPVQPAGNGASPMGASVAMPTVDASMAAPNQSSSVTVASGMPPVESNMTSLPYPPNPHGANATPFPPISQVTPDASRTTDQQQPPASQTINQSNTHEYEQIMDAGNSQEAVINAPARAQPIPPPQDNIYLEVEQSDSGSPQDASINIGFVNDTDLTDA